MYGSPGPTSQAQYPIGSLTWLRLRNKQLVNNAEIDRPARRTYPAAAMAAKSASVIHESQ